MSASWWTIDEEIDKARTKGRWEGALALLAIFSVIVGALALMYCCW